jgi:sperm-associated antigen 16 protein
VDISSESEPEEIDDLEDLEDIKVDDQELNDLDKLLAMSKSNL